MLEAVMGYVGFPGDRRGCVSYGNSRSDVVRIVIRTSASVKSGSSPRKITWELASLGSIRFLGPPKLPPPRRCPSEVSWSQS